MSVGLGLPPTFIAFGPRSNSVNTVNADPISYILTWLAFGSPLVFASDHHRATLVGFCQPSKSDGDPGELSIGRAELGRDGKEHGVEEFKFDLPTSKGFIETLADCGI